jgi:hypothetical protein
MASPESISPSRAGYRKRLAIDASKFSSGAVLIQKRGSGGGFYLRLEALC